MNGSRLLVHMLKAYGVEVVFGVPGDTSISLYEALHDAQPAIEESDTLLYIGCKMGSVSTINWTMPSRPQGRTLIQIDLNPEMLGNNYKNTLSVAGDARLVAEDLAILLKSRTPQREPSDWLKALNQQRSKFWKMAEKELALPDIPLKPQRVIAELNRHLPEDAIVISDAGTPTPYITRYLKLSGKGSRFIIPRSYGGLGYAIPAVVGAHFARPQAKVVGLFGDGSLGMSAGELETISRLSLPVVLVHFNNSTFGWIKALQRLHSQEKYFSVDFSAHDPAKVAEGFGLSAQRVITPIELAQAMEAAFSSGQPAFLDVATEPEVENLPPVYSWLKTAEKQ
jgi:acetolactate synthase-1/2/3 large subunit